MIPDSMADGKQTCYLYRIEKPMADFVRRKDDRHYKMCVTCLSEVLLARPCARREKLRHTSAERTCYLCRRVLPVAEVTRKSNGSLFSACKDCNRT